ncbi:MAG: hypothetical protein JXR83_15390 [Deltaproteobacteria bacterium]|nr:hypothetical protein [Deltaproteobacteria bacterium]
MFDLLSGVVLLALAATAPTPPVVPVSTDPPSSAASQPALDFKSAEQQVKAALAGVNLALTRRDLGSTIRYLERGLLAARSAAPLELSTLTVVDGIPEDLGMYRASPGGQVPGETMRLYVEVRNFGVRESGGSYEIALNTDAYFYYEDGEFFAGKKNIGEHRFSATTRHDVTFMVVELQLRGLPPQPYQIELVVTDAISGKVGKARVPFVITK